jgi:diguanylate cyclase (GGDEF)-like protein/PAS domain S-box-containing protein
MAGGEPRQVHFRIRRPVDGRIAWIEADLRGVRDEASGEVVEVHAALRDVTQRKAGERARGLWGVAWQSDSRGIVVLDPQDHTMLAVSPAFAALHGRTVEELEGTSMVPLVHPDWRPRIAEHAAAADHGERLRFESVHLRADGTSFPVGVEVVSLCDDAGAVLHRVGFVADLTDQRRALERFELSFDEAPVGIALLQDGRMARTNRALSELLGVPAEALLGRPTLDLVHPEDRAEAAKAFAMLARGEDPGPRSARVLAPDGRLLHVQLRTSVLPGERLVLVHVLDRTAEVAAQAARDEADALFRATFEHAPIGLAISVEGEDGVTRIAECNDAFARMLGRTPADVVGRRGSELMHPEDRPVREEGLERLREGAPAHAEARFVHAEGHTVWALVAGAPVPSADGRFRYVVQALDITERKRFEHRLRWLADHDTLTGLLSRRRFEEELERELARVRRTREPACVVLLDLDGFKVVNDAFGHAEGDTLLVRIAAALKLALRDVDVVARLGGDEFAAILPGTDRDGGEVAAAKLLEAVRAHGHRVTASAGLTVVTGAADEDAGTLLVEADVAMYQAKEAGKDAVVVYERGSGHRDRLVRRADYLAQLRRAVREERFALLAQPVVPLLDDHDAPERVELLLRLCGEDGRLVRPAAFLPAAERDATIVDIDRWVLRRAVGLLHDAQQAGRPLQAAVNFSARTLQEPRMASELERLLGDHPIAPGSLTVEVTETAAITNLGRAGELARQLRTMGCKLALDDFGAGWASFSYLKRLDFDVLKIDGEFIDRLPSSRTDQILVRAVVDVARGLGAELVAERVGDQATVEKLRELGVDFGQGHFLGRPAPITA